MRNALRAIAGHPKLKLQLVATGMHLDPAHGDTLKTIQRDGWSIDRVVPWHAGAGEDRFSTARNTGLATARLADAFRELKSDIVLVVGDRVEAFAAATAAHLSGIPVAHVHGGDRAAGQVDDALRHAITKLAHVHFPATRQSANRLKMLGEDAWRIRLAGSPGLDGIRSDAVSRETVRETFGELEPRRYALLVLHPADADEAIEERRARVVLGAVASIPYDRIVIVYPNNDPGAGGIIRAWEWAGRARLQPSRNSPTRRGSAGASPSHGESDAPRRILLHRDIPRPLFLALMRDAAVLVGNSSSGIIEAASFGTPVVDIGPRQKGRERGGNVVNVPYDAVRIAAELRRLWNNGIPRRFRSGNIYGGRSAGARIALVLASLTIDDRLLRKLIAY
jgi:UDP-N-acetylglucosamine 2-epimerase (non-hydrolysing)/GDP/UDP-N,N'-diacetylbacillosamine 2-epimerase (hydrolysing)